jgi:ABC-type anion transport system duplicated permease subunit
MAVRRVRRVLRKIDPWTVLKVSIVFNVIIVMAASIGIAIMWSLLRNSGIPDDIVNSINELAIFEEDINLDGPSYFRVMVFFSIVSTILLTGLATLSSIFYNLISDVMGGIEFVVLEEVLEAPRTTPQVRPSRSRTETPAVSAPPPNGPLAELPTEESPVTS